MNQRRSIFRRKQCLSVSPWSCRHPRRLLQQKVDADERASVTDDAGHRSVAAAERVVGRAVIALEAAGELPAPDALAQVEAERPGAECAEPVVARMEIVRAGIGEVGCVEA